MNQNIRGLKERRRKGKKRTLTSDNTQGGEKWSPAKPHRDPRTSITRKSPQDTSEGQPSSKPRRCNRTTLVGRDLAMTMHHRRNRRVTHILDHTTHRHHMCLGCGQKAARDRDYATTPVCRIMALHHRCNRRATRIRDHTMHRHQLCHGCSRKVMRGRDDAMTHVCHTMTLHHRHNPRATRI
jgi:hypothetical protein